MLKSFIRKIVPERVLAPILTAYHFLLAWGAAAFYGFPGKKLVVIGITGTKGKSSTAEMINAILEEAGYRTVLASTIRFKIGNESEPNLFKMTMPGRGYLQWVLAKAVRKGATHAVVELTSEGARQFRHAGLFLNALVFTQIAPEHIESHGSYDNYKKAKIGIGRTLVGSYKRPRIVVANPDDAVGRILLSFPVERALPVSLKDAAPYTLASTKTSLTFKKATFEIPFPGEFSVMNALMAATVTEELGVSAEVIARALQHMQPILGRVEMIDCGQPFLAVVDYAHTPDSLKALYAAFPAKRKICVLGNTGGGRDRWKRPEMGKIADEACAEVILTNEDPYDETPEEIVTEMAASMKRKPEIIMDRRMAIRRAVEMGRAGDAVLITGKGTDPYIMIEGGKKTPWGDAQVLKEELARLITAREDA